MKQVVGYVHLDGQNGAQYANGFESEKLEDGIYKITFTEPFDSYPVVQLTPVGSGGNKNPILKNAILAQAYGDQIIVLTGATDKPIDTTTDKWVYEDCSFFFTAVG